MNRYLPMLRLLAFAAVSSWLAGCGARFTEPTDGGAEASPHEGGPGACVTPDGVTLLPGQSHYDGCNTCECTAAGQLQCTARACPPDGWTPPPPPPPPPDGGGCYGPGGILYRVGEAWAIDACNTCTCLGDDRVACTSTGCVDGWTPPPPPPPPDGGPGCTTYDGRGVPVGGVVRQGCSWCRCQPDGLLQCGAPDCDVYEPPPPPPPPDGGLGCYTGDGGMVPAGAVVREGCSWCRCLPEGYLQCGAPDCDVYEPPPPPPPPPPPDGGPGCATPDGRYLHPGEVTWLGCGYCRCESFGGLSCDYRFCPDSWEPPPPPPPPGCTAPDGRRIALGERVAVTCGSCACVAPESLSCVYGDCVDAGGTGGVCNSNWDCPVGQTCDGPPGCGVTWRCGYSPRCGGSYGTFCACDGTSFYADSGCPGRHYAYGGLCGGRDAGTDAPVVTDGGGGWMDAGGWTDAGSVACEPATAVGSDGRCHGGSGRVLPSRCCGLAEGLNCNGLQATCGLPPPRCDWPNWVPTVRDGCWMGCASFDYCEPIPCAPEDPSIQCPDTMLCNAITRSCSLRPTR